MVRIGHRGVADEIHGRDVFEILLAEGVPDQRRLDLLAGLVGDLLDHLGELDLEKARHVDAVVALQDVGDAAFARLAVDADDRLVAAAEVGRVDRQVGHLPDLAVRGFERLEALVDGVLVRAREGGEHQVAAIGMARMDRQLVAVFDGLADLVDVREVDLGIDALGVHVEAQRDEVDVAGALAVAEQAALDAVGAGHEAELGRRHAGAAVVVRMQAQDHRIRGT